jgi:hypothetical protein
MHIIHIAKIESIIFPTQSTVCELIDFWADKRLSKVCSFYFHSTPGEKFKIILDPTVHHSQWFS